MKSYRIVFSPTGGTAKAAQIVSEVFGEAEEIDLSAQDFGGCALERDSLAVIAMPSFGGRAPKTAVERLKQITANGAKAVVIAVYGNRAQEDTLLEIADTAKACGFSVIAGIEAAAEHSIAHQYAAGRPDAEDAAQLRAFAERIREKAEHDAAAEPQIPGNRPYKKAGAGLVPKAGSACTGCGLCAAKCPVGAIPREDPKRTDTKVCINCMRCEAVCPQHARKANGLMVKAVGAVLKKACGVRKPNVLYL